MYQQQGENIASDCFREKNLSLYSVCTSLGTICTGNKGKTLPANSLERIIHLLWILVPANKNNLHRFTKRGILLSDFIQAPTGVIWRQFIISSDVSQKFQLTVLEVKNESSIRFYIRNSFKVFIKSKIEQLWGCER